MFARPAIAFAPALLVVAALTLSACGGGESDEVVYRYPNPSQTAETPKAEEDGIFDRLFGGSPTPTPGAATATTDPAAAPPAGEEIKTGLGVNNYLWRASLDTLSFMPLASADPFGGTIITDWYSAPETPNEQFKVTVYILDKELRADGVRVAVFRQARDVSGQWANATVPQDTATKLENAILTRARQLRVATVEE